MHLLPYIYFSSPALLTSTGYGIVKLNIYSIGKNYMSYYLISQNMSLPLGGPLQLVVLKRSSSACTPQLDLLSWFSSAGPPQLVLLFQSSSDCPIKPVLLRWSSSAGPTQVVLLRFTPQAVFLFQSSSSSPPQTV